MRALTGREPARALRQAIAADLAQFARLPTLTFVRSASHPAGAAYARQVSRGARRVGVPVSEQLLDETTTTAEAVGLVQRLAADEQVQGIIVALPLPSSVDTASVVSAVPPSKDVDRITRAAIGAVLAGASELAPGVATAVLRLLDFYEIPLAGRLVAVVGRSRGVGKPVALMLLARDATVVLCHSKTHDLAGIASQADVVVSCVGHPGLITREHVKPGAVVVDVGATYTAGGLRGDVEAEGVAQVASAYTPVPGGVGPLTVYCLLANLVSLTKQTQPR